MGGASVDARRKLEEIIVTTTEFRVDFIERAVEEASAAASAAAKAAGKAESVMIVLESRGFQVSAEQREMVSSCTDVSQLDLWLSRAGTASSADDVFKD
jgi:anti-sigma-K factor RskA